jgi:uncharacterized repeat protein (TIGR01451 family)
MTVGFMRKTRSFRATSAVLAAMLTFVMSNALYVAPIVLAEGLARSAAATQTAEPAGGEAPQAVAPDPPKSDEAKPPESAPNEGEQTAPPVTDGSPDVDKDKQTASPPDPPKEVVPTPVSAAPAPGPGSSKDATQKAGGTGVACTTDLGITKTADRSSASPGDPVGYTITVTNHGDVPVSGFSVTDSWDPTWLSVPGGDDGRLAWSPTVTLEPGKTWQVDYAGTITDPLPLAGHNLVNNTATVRVGGDSDPSNNEATWSVGVSAEPLLQIVKTVSPENLQTGSTGPLDYTIAVTNVGHAPAADVYVTDSSNPLLTVTGMSAPLSWHVAGPLAVGASITPITYTANLLAVPAGGTSIQNWAEARHAQGQDQPDSRDDAVVTIGTKLDLGATKAVTPVSDTATVTVVNPAIRITKVPSATLVHAGDEVTYTYTVTNIGDVPLENVIVSDDKLGTIGNGGTLQAGASTVLTATTTLSRRTVNVATVVGTYHNGDIDQTVTDNAFVDVDVINSAIQVAKTSDAPEDGVLPGTIVLYTYAVTNTGDTTLTTVAVSDDKLGDVGSVGTLAPGDSATLTASAVLDSSVTNVGSASGVDILGRTVTGTDQLTVRVFLPGDSPDLAIGKTADPTTARAGQTVTYTLRYRNLGAGTATDFTIVDDYDERYVTVTDASGGHVAGGKISWTLPGPLTAADGWQTITYKGKISDRMPSDTTNVDNVVVISVPDDSDPSNDTADARVVVAPFLPFTSSPSRASKETSSAPFLPFTGGNTAMLLVIAALSALGGLALRRQASRSL